MDTIADKTLMPSKKAQLKEISFFHTKKAIPEDGQTLKEIKAVS